MKIQVVRQRKKGALMHPFPVSKSLLAYLTSELGTGLSVDAPKPAISGPCPPVLLTNQVDEDGLKTVASVFPSPS